MQGSVHVLFSCEGLIIGWKKECFRFYAVELAGLFRIDTPLLFG